LLSDPCLVLQAFLGRPAGISKPCSRSWFAQFPIVPIDLPYLSASALNGPTAARSARLSLMDQVADLGGGAQRGRHAACGRFWWPRGTIRPTAQAKAARTIYGR
jgi:hypothetical protein